MTKTEALKKTEDKVGEILEGESDLTLLVLYRLLHDGRGFRMDGIQRRIEEATSALAETS